MEAKLERAIELIKGLMPFCPQLHQNEAREFLAEIEAEENNNKKVAKNE